MQQDRTRPSAESPRTRTRALSSVPADRTQADEALHRARHADTTRMPAPAGRGETLALANQLAHWAAAHLDQVDARRTEPVAAVTITIPGEGFVGGVQLPVQLVELLTGLLAADTPERHDRTPDTAPATPGLRVIEGGAR